VATDGEDPSDPVQKWAVQLRKGSLELAILACLWSEKLYGLEILRRLAEGCSLIVPEGTIYPLLSRLKHEGWVDSEWVVSEKGHPRNYYKLTPSGRRHARRLASSWSSFTTGVDRLLRPLRKEDD
jgi:PadR family transcriptional regulator